MAKLTKKKAKSKRLIRLIKQSNEVPQAFKDAFIPFFKKYSPIQIYDTFTWIGYGQTDKDVRYLVDMMKDLFFDLSALNNKWEGVPAKKLKTIAFDYDLIYPITIVNQLHQLLMAADLVGEDWLSDKIAIIGALNKALLVYHFLASERKLGRHECDFVGRKYVEERA